MTASILDAHLCVVLFPPPSILYLAPVVERPDGAIQQVNHYSLDKYHPNYGVIQWIVIFEMGSANQCSNYWGLALVGWKEFT